MKDLIDGPTNICCRHGDRRKASLLRMRELSVNGGVTAMTIWDGALALTVELDAYQYGVSSASSARNESVRKKETDWGIES